MLIARRVQRRLVSRAVAVLMLFPLAAASALAGGGAWNRVIDGYYINVGLESLSANDEFGFDGIRHPLFSDTSAFRNGSFGITNISFYGEIGLSNWLTGVASTQYIVAVREAFSRLTQRDSSASASGLGDLWLGARIRLLPRGVSYAAALTVSVKLPTGSPLQAVPLGTGVVDYEAAAAFGSSFPVLGDIKGYAQLSGGFRLRNGGASNELNYLTEIGVSLGEDFGAQVVLDGVHSFADFDAAADNPDNSNAARALTADQSFLRWRTGVSYAVKPGLDLNVAYTWNSAGRNALAISGPSVGLAWKR